MAIYQSYERRRKINYSLHLYEANKNPDIYDLNNELPPVELGYDEFTKLCKEERENYCEFRGRFALNPEEREVGEDELRSHKIFDLARLLSLVITLVFIMADCEELMIPCLIITVVIWVIGTLIAGPPWFNIF
jgi:hypothetical protein